MDWLTWILQFGGVGVHIGGKTPSVLYFDVALFVYLAYQFALLRFPLKRDSLIIPLGVLCIIAAMLSALVNSNDIPKSLAALKILVIGLIVYALALHKPPKLFNLAAFGAAIGVLLVLTFQAIRFDEYEGPAGMKDFVQIPLGKSNHLASILLLLIPLSIAGIALYRGAKRLLMMAFSAMMLVGFIVTMSRGAMLALALTTLFCIPLLWKAGFRWKQWALSATFAGILLLLIPADLLLINAALISSRSDSGRLELMGASWESFVDNPILGVGPGQLGNAISHRVIADDTTPYMNAHNLVLNSLAEYGLPGLLILAMVGIVLCRAWTNMRKRPTAMNTALFFAMLAVVLHNMVEATFEWEQFQVVFWSIAAIVESSSIRSTVRSSRILSPLSFRHQPTLL